MSADLDSPASPPDFSVYRCPVDGGPLRFEPARPGSRSGVLVSEKGNKYPVDEGLPRFVEDEGYSASFGFQWNTHDRTQIDSDNGSTITQDRFFRGTGWPRRMEGERILEVGCGSGRFTEVLVSTGADVCSLDYSRAADVTHRHFGDRVHVCQASIYDMPYEKASFDRVFCFGVIQHCPDVHAAFNKLTEMLKPGGHLALDVYDARRVPLNARYRVRWLTKRLPKELLYQTIARAVPAYMRVMPPLHPYNQLVFPIKDYRGVLPVSEAKAVELSVLDTFDSLSPAHDRPQFRWTMKRWCRQAGLVDIDASYAGNGIELRARRPG
ncbi:MAG: methyltransferase domain-containing protein [Myxococcales bacterium]|mgnify:CR=1 FL=1|nr:methyltransferase domain-containing protein [Myxococcales bacterium]